MDDIVQESNMSKGAIYHYFSSKKEVYLGVIDYWKESIQISWLMRLINKKLQ